jgi:hypothetical protein
MALSVAASAADENRRDRRAQEQLAKTKVPNWPGSDRNPCKDKFLQRHRFVPANPYQILILKVIASPDRLAHACAACRRL